jgi:hypothetical protein
MLVLRQINLEYVANDRSAGESRTQIPLWELRSRTLTPLWKRGEGEIFGRSEGRIMSRTSGSGY